MNRKISIIIPCYNQACFLEDALNSVLEQTYLNWECIIVNDGSTDDTKIVGEYWSEKDSRFIYLEKKNGGLSSARNAGLNVFKGDYVQFLDADDCLHSNKIEMSINMFGTEHVDMVVSNFNLFKHSEKPLPPYCMLGQEYLTFNSVLYKWDDGFSIPIHCGIFRSSLLENFRFPEHLKAKEDWVMWVSFFKKSTNAIFINKSLAYYRLHDKSMMYTTNMHKDFLNAVKFLETIVSVDEHKELTLELISRFYRSQVSLKRQLRSIKKTNTYKAGYLIKRIILKLGLLGLVRKINKRLKLI